MTNPQRYSDAEICQLLHYWDGRYPEALTLDLFCRETGIGTSTVQRRFGGWLALRTAAGLERRKSHLRKARTRTVEEFVAKLKVAVGHYGKFITQQEFCTWMSVSPNTLQSYCGSWRKLRALVGLPERKRRQRLYTDFELMDEICRLIQHFGRWPTSEEINRQGRFSYATYADRFGSMHGLRQTFDRFGARCREEMKRRGMEIGEPASGG